MKTPSLPAGSAIQEENEILREENVSLHQEAAQREQDLAELSESEEHYRVLVEQVREYAIFGMDPDGVINSWNRGAQRIKGFTAEEAIGQHLHLLYLPEDREKHDPEKHLAYAAKHGEFHGEGWRCRRDGSRFWAEVTLTALRRRNGSLRGFCKVTKDVTERRRHEQELERHAKELQRSNDDLQQLAYAAAHDLQEPIRNISLQTQRLARLFEGQGGPETANLFQITVEGADRLRGLVSDLLAYIRAVENLDEESPVSDPLDVLQEVQMHLRSALEESGGMVTAGHLPESIPVYRAHLVLLLQNLISNSIKYRSPQRPLQIRVWAEQLPHEWLFNVEDNGIGIAREYHDRIFKVFKRLHGRSIPGSGIGLAIACRVSSHYGGRIWVESDGQSGSRFRFTLARPTAEETE